VSGGEDNPLGLPSEPPAPEPREEPPADARGRHEEWVADHDTETRDLTPALGTPGEPASWRPAAEREHVALAQPAWGDAGWSFLYGPDTRYGDVEPETGGVAAANRRMRQGAVPDDLKGPFIKAPVWTWEVPFYFWVGGIASGSAFVALAADLAGDEWSASLARKVALGAVLPAPALLIADLGRPARFLNMLRVFKPRSPMNLGAWCLAGFTTVGAGAVAADVLGRRRTARGLGAVNAVLGGYLGSYTGVLLAATAVPLWARSRIFLGPIFVSTATATGAAATRMTLVATGRRPVGHPTRVALNRLEAGAMLAELALSAINERRLGRAGHALSEGRPGRLFRAAQCLVGAGVALNLLGVRRVGVPGQNVASALYLAGGLAFRFAWVEAGKASARDDEAVALMARGRVTADERLRKRTERRIVSDGRPPRAGGTALAAARAWSGTMGRTSILMERLLRRA
jgi:formate-dependent nitrite reductase membrane component NrfD